MPIYEFQCRDCGKSFDKLCSFRDNLEDMVCMHCSAKNVIKKMSAFSAPGSGDRLKNSSGSSSCSTCSSGSCASCK